MNALTFEQVRAIDLAKEGLVVAAEKLLDDAKVETLSSRDFGDSQLRNLIAIATETESSAVVANFIRYQMGRDPRGRGWNNTDSGTALGQRLIDEIDQGAIHRAIQSIPGLDGNAELTQMAKIRLVRHFLGFASRYLKYVNLVRGRVN